MRDCIRTLQESPLAQEVLPGEGLLALVSEDTAPPWPPLPWHALTALALLHHEWGPVDRRALQPVMTLEFTAPRVE